MPNSSQPVKQRLLEAGRRLSVATIAFHRCVAARLGLNDTDHKCLDILLREGPMIAGSLAQRGGYTTGAITGIVNRLAAQGLVERRPDPSDARRVTIVPIPSEVGRRMGPIMGPLAQAFDTLYDQYTPEQLELIHDFMEQSVALLSDQTQRMRSG